MFWILIMVVMAAVPGKVRAECEDEEVFSLLKRHEIQVLLKAGFDAPRVAKQAGVSIDTVRRVGDEPDVEHTDDASEHRTRRIGRPPKAAPFADKVQAWLADDPDTPTQELLRRAKEAKYPGSKSAFYALVAGLRPKSAPPVVRFEGLPGEFSQHDFGHVDVRYVDGTKERVHFFASRLKYSRFVAVSLVEDERVETILRGLVRDFKSFGGLPLMAVFDRPRTIVTRSGEGRAVEEFNSTFAQGIVDIGVGVEMCAPRSGNQKGSVERLVGWVKSSFFKPRKFVDRTDLVAQLAAWVDHVNTKVPSRATGEIPETRRQEELPRLRPNKVHPETLALRFPAFVGPTAEVMFEGAPYTMPPEATNVAATIFVFQDRVRIVAGRWSSEQARRKKGDPRAPVPEHRAAKLAAVHGKRAKLYEKRQQILDLGADALELLTEITHRERGRAGSSVERLYELLERYGDLALRGAITSAVGARRLTVNAVLRALLVSARRDPSEPPPDLGETGELPPLARWNAAPARSGHGAAQPRGRNVSGKAGAKGRAVCETRRSKRGGRS